MRRVSFGLGQRGDTIIEVLISMAIISLVLAGAFVATNQSLRGTRGAQERSDGVKLVEGQIEQLKAVISATPDDIFGSGAFASYCIYNASTYVSTNTNCRVNAAGTPTTAEPIYNLSITRTGNTFTLLNTWKSQTGPDGKVQMKYRVYD